MKSVCIALIFIFLLYSCSKKETTEPALTTGTISGTVMNKAGDSVVTAAIITTEPPTSSVSSNADGKYTIQDVDPGDYIVQAIKDGHDPGNVNVTVKAGKTVTADIRLGILLANHPPAKPQLVSPENNSERQFVYLTLQWKEAADQDGDAVVYDLYFGKENPPPLDKENMDSTSLKINDLDTATVYYWQVVAKDSKGAKTASNIWHFKTMPNPIPNDGLFAYYPFNGNANDESGNGNNGTVYGATLAKDRFGKENSAYYFDGDNDYIEIPNNEKISPSIAISISVWINFQPGGSYNPRFISKDQDRYTGYEFLTNTTESNREITFSLKNTGVITTPLKYNSNIWLHLVGTYDGHKICIYVNGELVISNNASGNISTNNYSLWVGQRRFNNLDDFKGLIDDICIYNRALTEEEIKILYHESGWEVQ